METERFKTKKAAEILDISVKTLQRYEKKGWLVPYRTVAGRPWYSREQLDEFLGKGKPRESKDKPATSAPAAEAVSDPAVAAVQTQSIVNPAEPDIPDYADAE